MAYNTISVVIPVYNCEDTIEKCIQSVLSQDNKDFEIVLIDDHSQDNSFGLCERYQLLYTNIHLYTNPGKGVSSARNYGITKSSGDYIIFIDSDDELEPYALSVLCNELGKYDYVMAGYCSVYDNNYIVEHKGFNYKGSIFGFLNSIEDYLRRSLIQGPCWKLFNRKIIILNNIIFPEDMNYGEDAYFVYKYLMHVSEVKTIDQVVYRYNIQSVSLSHVFRKDKILINIMLNGLLKDLLDFSGVDGRTLYIKMNRNSYISFVNEIIKCKVDQPIFHIKNSTNYTEIQESFNNKTGLTRKELLLRFLVIHRMYFFIWALFYIKNLRNKRG